MATGFVCSIIGDMATSKSFNDRYELRIAGRLSATLVEELTSAEIADVTTGFTVEATDEAALHGLLRRIEKLGLEIDSITRSSRSSPGRPQP